MHFFPGLTKAPHWPPHSVLIRRSIPLPPTPVYCRLQPFLKNIFFPVFRLLGLLLLLLGTLLLTNFAGPGCVSKVLTWSLPPKSWTQLLASYTNSGWVGTSALRTRTPPPPPGDFYTASYCLKHPRFPPPPHRYVGPCKLVKTEAQGSLTIVSPSPRAAKGLKG